MNSVDFIFKEDLSRLIQRELMELEKFLPELKENKDKQSWLYENISEWKDNENVKKIIFQKIYAGQCSVRLYKVPKDTLSKVILKLESNEFSFNTKTLNKGDSISILCTYRLSDDNYMIRLRCNNGIRRRVEVNYEEIVYSVVIFDIKHNVFQIRADNKLADKIKRFLQYKLDIVELEKVNVLQKYISIKDFASAINGTFNKVKANPSYVVGTLNEKDQRSLRDLITTIDNYMLDKNSDVLKSSLDLIEFDTNLTFSQLMLAGCRDIGLTTENIDLSNQAIYNLIGEDIVHDYGSISVKTDGFAEQFTIKLSSDGGINFQSSVDEHMISYIISYVLGVDDLQMKRDESELKRLHQMVEGSLSNMDIKGIREEYLLRNFRLNEQIIKQELQTYIDSGDIITCYELSCCEDGKGVSARTLDDLLMNARMLTCNFCSNFFEGTDSLENFIEANLQEIKLTYYFTETEKYKFKRGNVILSLVSQMDLNSYSESENISRKRNFFQLFNKV